MHIQTDSLGVLLLKNLQPEARGAYVCSASNTIGKAATASVDIQLLCKDHLHLSSCDILYHVFLPFTLFCHLFLESTSFYNVFVDVLWCFTEC